MRSARQQGSIRQTMQNGGSMCGPLRRVAALRDRWRPPVRLVQGPSGAIGRRRRYLRGNAGSLRGLLGRETERFGMGPAVVLSEDLTEAAGPVRDGAWQIWQRVTGSWVTVTGKRREGDLLICIYDASPAGVIMPRAWPHALHAA